MTRSYQFLRVDQSVVRVASRYHTDVPALYELNDPGLRHGSQQAWVATIRPGSRFLIPYSPWEMLWEWDEWDDEVQDNPNLAEFCDAYNERQQAQASRNRNVGPLLAPGLLWNALPNADFRRLVLEQEERSGGQEGVRQLDAAPANAYIRVLDRAGRGGRPRTLLVPAAPVSTSRPAAAIPRPEGGAASNELRTRDAWIRELEQKVWDIEAKTQEYRQLILRQRAVVRRLAPTIANLGRLREFLRILVDGRNETNWAGGDASSLQAMAGLRERIRRIEQRVAEASNLLQNQAVPAAVVSRVDGELRDLKRDPRLHELWQRMTSDRLAVFEPEFVLRAQNALGEGYRTALEAGSAWAHEDIERSIAPDPRTPLATIALAAQFAAPFFGNTPGPPSVYVLIQQYRAMRVLQRVATQQLTGAQQAEEVRRLVAAFVATETASVTAAAYARADFDVALQRSTYAVVVNDPSLDSPLVQQHRVNAAAEAPALRINRRIMAILNDTTPTHGVEWKRQQLRIVANEELRPRVNTSNAVSVAVLVLNLILLAAQWFSDPRPDQLPVTVASALGCTYTAGMALLQIISNVTAGRAMQRGVTSLFSQWFERASTPLGVVAAALGFIQGVLGIVSTYRDWGMSHPWAFWSSVMSTGSGVIVFSGWVMALYGVAGASAVTGIGLAFGLIALGISLVSDDDPATKTFFVEFTRRIAASSELRDADIMLLDAGLGSSISLASQLSDLARDAGHLTFPLAVWNEIPALQALGFRGPPPGQQPGQDELSLLTHPGRPTRRNGPMMLVGPAHPAPNEPRVPPQ